MGTGRAQKSSAGCNVDRKKKVKIRRAGELIRRKAVDYLSNENFEGN